MLVAAGCSPAGPRALLKGKKYLDQGDYAAAAAQFKTATTLLATNAAAWNYYGVALQRNGQPDESANAYRRALDLDRDLLEARLNLGTLYLEQNQAESAKTEFTAYTLRRPNDAAGWLKLGSAQLKLGEIVPAERSFSSVYHMDTNNPAALNGLGLARIQRNRPREAAQFFAAAVQAQPDYAPALLNLASVNQQYLRDNKAALDNYRAYLALTPRPANWDEVNALVASLEQPAVAAAAPAPVAGPPVTPAAKPAAATVALVEPKPKASNVTPARPAQPPRTATPKPAVSTVVTTRPTPATPVQMVKVSPETPIVTTPHTAAPAKPTDPSLEAPMPEPAPKPGLFSRMFGASKPANGVTPLPDTTGEPAVVSKQAPVVIVPPAPVQFPRYNYLSPSKPAAGDRRAANGAFTQAQLAEQDEKWPAALQAYRQAAAFDPAWFEAQYNAGVIAHRLRNYSTALACYETALAIQPDSVNARYNFALALKAAGYAPDAAGELRKILEANPKEVRAHLALANLCAQALRDPAQARQHYHKVLELDPAHPQTADIRFWLAANPG